MLKNKELSLKDLTGQRLWQLQLSLKGPEPIRVQAAAGLLGPSPQEGPCRMPGAGCTRGCCCAARVLGAGRAPAPLRGTGVAARSRGWGRRPEPRREGSLSLCPSLPSFLCSQVCWPTLASGSLPGERLNHAERLRHAVPRLGLPQLQSVGGGQPAAGRLEPSRGAAEPLSSSQPAAGMAQRALPAACRAPAFPGKCEAGKSAATGSKH